MQIEIHGHALSHGITADQIRIVFPKLNWKTHPSSQLQQA